MKTKYVLSLGIVLLFTFMWSCQGSTEEKNEAGEGYHPAHDFILTDLEGDTIHLADFRGKVVILNFWDTWCGPCRLEIPDFIQLYDEYNSQGFMMIGIAGGRLGVESVQDFVQDYGINYPVVMLNQKLYDDYGPITGIPTTFVLNRKSQIVKKYVGYRQKSVFENDIKTLLEEEDGSHREAN